jgi:hypothetical protein
MSSSVHKRQSSDSGSDPYSHPDIYYGQQKKPGKTQKPAERQRAYSTVSNEPVPTDRKQNRYGNISLTISYYIHRI